MRDRATSEHYVQYATDKPDRLRLESEHQSAPRQPARTPQEELRVAVGEHVYIAFPLY